MKNEISLPCWREGSRAGCGRLQTLGLLALVVRDGVEFATRGRDAIFAQAYLTKNKCECCIYDEDHFLGTQNFVHSECDIPGTASGGLQTDRCRTVACMYHTIGIQVTGRTCRSFFMRFILLNSQLKRKNVGLGTWLCTRSPMWCE